MLVEYNSARFEAVWLDEEGRPRVEQIRVSGLLGDDDIAFAHGPDALDLSALTGRGRDFVAVLDGGPGNDSSRAPPVATAWTAAAAATRCSAWPATIACSATAARASPATTTCCLPARATTT